MKVAFTSSDGNFVDSHFGNSEAFFIWELDPRRAKFLGRRAIPEQDGQDDRIRARTDVVLDCAIVCTEQIGGPAAAKLVAQHIHPMKTTATTPIAEMIERLQNVLRGHPAPWLRKAMLQKVAPPDFAPDQPE
jgi:nitrogen fixation protein NifX